MSDRNHTQPPVETPSTDNPARVFTTALVGVVVAWSVIALILICTVATFSADLFKSTVVISLLSGLISVASMIPGLVREWMPDSDSTRHASESTQDTNGKHDYIGTLFGGMILRLVATVALFVLCRYQMAAPHEWIAALTLGWYVILTTTEVILLAKRLPQTDTFVTSSLTASVIATA